MQRLPAVLRSEGSREREGEGGSHATGKRGRMLGTAAIVTGGERGSQMEEEEEKGWMGARKWEKKTTKKELR